MHALRNQTESLLRSAAVRSVRPISAQPRPHSAFQFDAAHTAIALSLSLSDVAALRLIFLMDGLQ